MKAKQRQAPLPPKGGVPTTPAVIHSADKFLYIKLREKAEYLRENSTEAESMLWKFLQNNKLGVKFRRQHIINKFIVDFYCIEKSLVVEIDGEIHEFQKARDEERESILKRLGCKVLRLRDELVMNDIVMVIEKIKLALE